MASWLLDTDLMKLLPEGNTREFVKRFTVLQVNKSDVFEDGWRVFTNEWTEEFEKLPGRTKLQRAIRGYLQRAASWAMDMGSLLDRRLRQSRPDSFQKKHGGIFVILLVGDVLCGLAAVNL